MKTGYAIALIGGAMLFGTQAFAQAPSPSATSDITLIGRVPQRCSFGVVTMPIGDGATFSEQDGVNPRVTFEQEEFVNASGGHTPKTLTLQYENAMCNSASTLTLSSLKGGMKPLANPAEGFAKVIHYTADATWGSEPLNLLNTEVGLLGNGNSAEISPRSATLKINIKTKGTNLPLIFDGNPYADTLNLKISPKL